MKNIGFARFERALVFLGEQAELGKQREGQFDAPSLRQNDESTQSIRAFDHLERWIFAMSPHVVSDTATRKQTYEFRQTLIDML